MKYDETSEPKTNYKVVTLTILAHVDDLDKVVEEVEDLMTASTGFSIRRGVRRPTTKEWRFFKRETRG